MYKNLLKKVFNGGGFNSVKINLKDELILKRFDISI